MSAGFEHEMPRLAPDGRPRVLMVTGAYYPEVSGAGLQCRALIQVLADRVRCMVLTTATDPALAANDLVDGVPVYRIHIDVNRWTSTAAAFVRMVRRFLALRRDVDIVHLHGFSRKSVLLVRLAHLLGKKIVVKLTSVGHDDACSMRGWTRWPLIPQQDWCSWASRNRGITKSIERLAFAFIEMPSGSASRIGCRLSRARSRSRSTTARWTRLLCRRCGKACQTRCSKRWRRACRRSSR